MFLSSFSINLPAFYHECCSLISYTAHYLLCEYVSLKRISIKFFRGAFEEDFDKVLND